jgi:transcriptional regulator with XRE-family HTH domain
MLQTEAARLTRTAMLTPAQLRAARALAGWSREKLAEESGVSSVTCKLFELGDSDPRLSTLRAWRRALEAAGGIFIDPDGKSEEGGAGVRMGSQKRR